MADHGNRQGPASEPAGPGEKRLAAIGLGLILALALFLRLRQFATLFPWLIFEDDLRTTQVTLRLLQNRTADPAFTFYPSLVFYFNAVGYLAWATATHLPQLFRQGPGAIFGWFQTLTPEDPRLLAVSRAVSLVFGLGTLVSGYFFFRLYLSVRWALFGVLLFALNSVHVFVSASAKVDAANIFLITTGFFFQFKYYREGGWKWLILASSFAGLSLVAKYNYHLPITLGVALLCRNHKARSWLALPFSREMAAGVALMAGAAFLGSPYTFLRPQNSAVMIGWLFRQSELISFYHTDTYAWWRDRYFYLLSVSLPFIFTLPVFWLAVAGLCRHAKKYGAADVFLVLNPVWFLYVYASQAGGPLGGSFPYYLFMHTIALVILPAAEFLQELSRSSRRGLRAAGLALAGVALAWSILSVSNYWAMFNSGWDELGPWMKSSLPVKSKTLMLTVYKPGPALRDYEVKAVWPQDFTAQLIAEEDPDYLIIDTWAIGGFKKFYRNLWVAPLAEDLISGRRGYRPIARFRPAYFSRSYFAALDPEHDAEIVVLEKSR